MAEEENQGPALVIKKRTKPRGQTKSSRSLASEAVQDAVSNEDDHEGSAVVRRSVKSVKSRTNSKLSFAGDQQPKVEKAISRPAIAVPNSDHDAVSSQSAAARSHSSYSSADLDALRASTRSASELTQAKFGHLPYSQADQEMIPTENAVAAAKMKRDMLRRTGQTDFIALDGSAESQEVILAGDKGGESRLMREEDELGEGDEDLAEFTGAQDRIGLSSRARKDQERNKRAGIVDMLEEAQLDDDDIEMRRWEDAQIRRSGHASHQTVDIPSKISAKIPSTTAVPTFNLVNSRLAASLSSAQESQQANLTLSDQSAQLSSLQIQESDLRAQVESTSTRYEFFSALRAWIEDDLVSFLDVKFPLLERVEKRNREIQEERHNILQGRRFEAHAAELAVWTKRPVLADYASLKQLPSAEESESPPPLQNQRFVSPMESAPITVVLTQSEKSDLASAAESLSREEEGVLADVTSDDWRDPSGSTGAAGQFRRWKEKFPDEYKLSFAGLVLVQVWEFWARLELARWDPFQVAGLTPSPSSLEQLHCHEALTTYAHETQEEENLFGALIADVVLPKLQELAVAWDPFDATATIAVIKLVDECSYGIDKNGRKFETLISAYLRQVQFIIFVLQQQVLPLLPMPPRPEASTIATNILGFLENCMRWRRLAREVRLQGGGLGRGVGVGQRLEEVLVVEVVGKVLLPILKATADAQGAKRTLSLFSKSFALTAPIADELRAM